MPCDGWELHEAYWRLVLSAADGVAVVWWACESGGLDGARIALTPRLASVLLNPSAEIRVAGLIGFAYGARASLAQKRSREA